MTHSPVLTTAVLTATAVTGGLLAAAPASAGGIGDLLSPAFAADCANHHTGAQGAGATTAGSGALNANALGLPLGSALNQCGGADMPLLDHATPNRNQGDIQAVGGQDLGA